MAGEGEAARHVVGGEMEAEASTGRMCRTWHNLVPRVSHLRDPENEVEPGMTAYRSSEEFGSRSCGRRARHDLRIAFAGMEATHLLVYVAC